jgi:hypothetical protein
MYQTLDLSVAMHGYCASCNKVAHALEAVGAGQLESKRLWLDDVPDFVMVLVAGDITEPLI